jgi:hypothetical protein
MAVLEASTAKGSCDRTTGAVFRGTESLLTHRWRELDSNHRFPEARDAFGASAYDPPEGEIRLRLVSARASSCPRISATLDRVCSQSTLSGISKKLSSMAAEPTASSRACCCISRGGSGERRKVALNELVVEALNLAYHGARAKDPNFDLTPRALRMTKDAPTGAATAATSDCWPNLGLRGPGVFVAMRDRQVAIPPRPQNGILPCSELPR